jgi:hypothetical protein
MSEIDKIKEIYKKNIFLPSNNNICGIVTKDNAAYKCPSNKFCNYGDEEVGICENTGCYHYNIKNIDIDIDISKFDGSSVSRNRMTNICDRKISKDGKCGLDNNSTKCPDGQCCSIRGKCGYDKESCIYISPYYSNNIIGEVNRNYYSNYNDVKKFQYEFIKQIGNKYIGNNNFEISTNGKCGLDLENEKIFKCPDNQYCDEYDKCSMDYNNYNNNNSINLNLNLQDLDLNLIHGNKFKEEHDKWKNNKEKLQSIRNKYINNNKFEISTDGRCGIDLENEKIFKCSDKQYCNQYNKCSVDYNNYQNFDFDNNSLKDINSNAIYSNEQRRLKDLSSNLIHGNKFNEEYDKWLNTKKEKIQSIRNKYINNNNFEISTDGRCGIDLENEKIFKCSDKQYCDQYNKCSENYDTNSYSNRFRFDNSSLKDINSNAIYNNEEIKLKDLNSNLIHGNKFNEEYNNFRNPLDCNNTKLLDSFKTFFNNKTGNVFKIVDIVKINKVDNKTCDIKYNFEGKFSGQNSRRITFQYNPDVGYVCTNIDGGMSGLTTLPLDPNKNVGDEMSGLTTQSLDFKNNLGGEITGLITQKNLGGEMTGLITQTNLSSEMSGLITQPLDSKKNLGDKMTGLITQPLDTIKSFFTTKVIVSIAVCIVFAFIIYYISRNNI